MNRKHYFKICHSKLWFLNLNNNKAIPHKTYDTKIITVHENLSSTNMDDTLQVFNLLQYTKRNNAWELEMEFAVLPTAVWRLRAWIQERGTAFSVTAWYRVLIHLQEPYKTVHLPMNGKITLRKATIHRNSVWNTVLHHLAGRYLSFTPLVPSYFAVKIPCLRWNIPRNILLNY